MHAIILVYIKVTTFEIKERRRILLGHVSKRRRVGTGHKEILVNEEFVYVPLLKSLEQMLNQSTVLS